MFEIDLSTTFLEDFVKLQNFFNKIIIDFPCDSQCKFDYITDAKHFFFEVN